MSRWRKHRVGGRDFLRDAGGATAVEFALIAPLLFFGLLSILEISMLAMMTSGLDNAVLEASRRIRTNRDDVATSAAAFKDQICGQLGGDLTTCRSRVAIGVQKFSKFVDASTVASSPPDGGFDAGHAGDIIIVKVDYQWPLMTPFLATAFNRHDPMSVTLGSRLAFKNEPYQ
jgi:Flp pilus assembly protein TadG